MNTRKTSFLAYTLLLAAVVAALSANCGGRKATGGHAVDGLGGTVDSVVVDVADDTVGDVDEGTYFTDPRDDHRYRTVKIGKQEWMAENLSYKTRQSWCYKNDGSNCQAYGRLYDWKAAKAVCPDGWRLPTIDEWAALMKAIGSVAEVYDGGGDEERYAGAGGKLKSKTGWNGNGNGTDDYNFSALPAGFRQNNGTFDVVGKSGGWWSATDNGGGSAVGIGMGYIDGHAYESDFDKEDGFSVRCIK